jgi:cyclophilin family peptidyl-prolyl cis-trans isomerase
MRFRHFALRLGLLLLATPGLASADTYLRFSTNLGNIDVDLFSSTPNTVANFMSYVNNGSYTNLIINRSVPGFVLQAGAVNLVNNGFNLVQPDVDYSTNPLLSEAGVSNTRGTLAMALSNGPNTGTNEWFFNEVDNSAVLDGSADGGPFTVFGQVMNTSSLSVMDAIANVPVFSPPDDSPFITPADYAADTNPNGPSPDDFTLGRLPLVNYTLGNDASPNTVLVSNLIIISSITTLSAPQTFTAWQTATFTATQQGNPNFIAPSATPFNDGVANLLKYVYDINPSVPMTGAEISRLPTVGTFKSGGTQFQTLTYHQHNELTGVTVSVQTSPDLVTWTTLSNPVFVQTGTDSAGDPIEQVQVPFTGTQQFIRLKVTMP